MSETDLLQEQQDEQMIEAAFQHLIDTYLKSPHRKKTDIITRAYHFAKQAHKGVKRLSGEPYIMHPIAVAQIAAEEMGLGSTSICSALLHDVVEDTEYSVEDIKNLFGDKIAQIVDGLTKISGGIFGERASAQAENFKKLLLTMNDDIRVVLIKICDRLHNMRTLDSQPPNKQYKIAGETLYIYAPLADRLGLHKIKNQLENLCFKFEHPEEYAEIVSKLNLTQEDRQKLFDEFTQPIRQALDERGIDYKILARVKTPFSIWSKMQRKSVTFEEVYDILAVRIVFTPKNRDEELNECYDIYVALQSLYNVHHGRVRDWLGTPKSNGYQALHVTLMSKKGKWIEVQIRSDRMDEIAEQGFAAHWQYKEGGGELNDNSELSTWLSTIREILDDPQPDAMDFLDSIKLNLFSAEIALFTPRGEIVRMPRDCSVLDFAFQIHTFLGSHCIGAKVNHKLVPLSHKLHSGDQVEILTSSAQHVDASWLNFVNTAKAKNKIMAILRRNKRETQKQGETQLNEWLAEHKIPLTSTLLERLLKIADKQKPADLYFSIGHGITPLNDDLLALITAPKYSFRQKFLSHLPFINNKKTEEPAPPKEVRGNDPANPNDPLREVTGEVVNGLFVVGKNFNKKIPVIIDELSFRQLRFPDCCHPIPGDDILGFILDDKTIEIHQRKCKRADILKTSYGNRILDAKWNMHRQMLFDATIIVDGIDRKGLLLDVSKVLSDQLNVNIRQITINANEGIFHGTLELKVYDRADMKIIIEKLKQVKGLQEVQQIL